MRTLSAFVAPAAVDVEEFVGAVIFRPFYGSGDSISISTAALSLDVAAGLLTTAFCLRVAAAF
jgi:hypothetical protein